MILNMRTHFPFLLILLIFCFFIILASGQRNVSIDDWDAAIYYRPPGAWYMSTNTSLNFGGAHMLTQNPNATALFNFTGIAIYFLSPRWPYQVNTALSLDGGPVTVVDLVDHSRPDTGGFGAETVPYDVVWSAEGLTDTSHSLVISVEVGQPFAIVDGLIYTVVDDGVGSSPAPSPTSTSPPSPPTLSTGSVGSSTSPIPSTTPSNAPAAGSGLRSFIAVGTVLGVLGLLIVSLLVWCCFRKKRRRPKSEAWTIARSPSKGTPSPTTMSGQSSISLGPPATYPMPPISGFQHPYHSMYVPPLSEEEAWQNPRYGYVGMPAPITSPSLSVHSAEPYARTYDLNYLTSGPADDGPMMVPTSAHSLWRYTPGVPLSPITENSPSTTEKSLSLRGSPASAPSEKATSTRSDISGARTPTGFRSGSQLAQSAFTSSPF